MLVFGHEPQLHIDCLFGTREPLELMTFNEWTTSHRNAMIQSTRKQDEGFRLLLIGGLYITM